jgi:hypothetical protein
MPGYYWVVVCKNHRFHNQQNQFFGHKIPLGETDAYTSVPVLDGQFNVRCDDCGKEYSYRPSDVLRFEQEEATSFRSHPLFL